MSDFIDGDPGDAFWLGWLAAAMAGVAVELRLLDGRVLPISKADAAKRLEVALDAFITHSARPAGSPLASLADGLLWGFSVLDARGECYTLRQSYEDAQRAVRAAEDFLDGAATCGHPAAGPWVRERLPFTIEQITRAQRAEILEDGTPTLDREP